MNNESNIRHGGNCVFKLHVHLMFVTKHRRPVFDTRAIDVLRGLFADVCSDAQATLVEMDGEDDHVHLLVEYSRKAAISSLVSSRRLRTDIHDSFAVGAILPRPEGRGLPRVLVNSSAGLARYSAGLLRGP